jgi:peptidoglycan/LPS O-acetylase OafA/YrhL
VNEIAQPRSATGIAAFWRRKAPAPEKLFKQVRDEATDLPYRPDVDGLRGIAVLAVVAFHANFYQVSGGYAGVDVFFVISGFLITGIITRDLATGRFTLAHFYERRVRRILPALFMTLAGVTLLSLLLSSPLRLQQFGKALLYSSFFGTNFLFAGATDYFDPGYVGQPLLHTWSLSVEEQYYFVYPAFVAFLFARRWPLASVLLLGIAASLAFSEWQVLHSAKAAFYGTPARAWELFAGGLLAGRRLPKIQSRAMLELIALCGALAIAGAFVAFKPATTFPGLHALLPVLGAFAIIYAGGCGRTFVNRALAMRPIVWIGLISYSLYLWHWPLLMLLRDVMGDEVRRRYVLASILLSVLIAWGSLFLVEIPVRRRAILRTRRQVFTAAAIGLVSLAAVGAWLSSSPRLLGRYPPEARTILAFADEPIPGWHYETCFITAKEQNFSAGECLRIDPHRRNALLLGDSHAAHLRSGIEDAYPGINLLQANGCNAVLGAAYEAHCGAFREAVFRKFLPQHRMDLIIVSQSWFDDDRDVPRIAATVAYLRRFSPKVVVIGQTPDFDRPVPDLLAFDRRFGTDLTQRHLVREISKLDARMEALAGEEGWAYVSGYKAMCPDHCLLYAAPGIPLYRDDGHFTVAGSRLFAERALKGVLAPQR